MGLCDGINASHPQTFPFGDSGCADELFQKAEECDSRWLVSRSPQSSLLQAGSQEGRVTELREKEVTGC